MHSIECSSYCDLEKANKSCWRSTYSRCSQRQQLFTTYTGLFSGRKVNTSNLDSHFFFYPTNSSSRSTHIVSDSQIISTDGQMGADRLVTLVLTPVIPSNISSVTFTSWRSLILLQCEDHCRPFAVFRFVLLCTECWVTDDTSTSVWDN